MPCHSKMKVEVIDTDVIKISSRKLKLYVLQLWHMPVLLVKENRSGITYPQMNGPN